MFAFFLFIIIFSGCTDVSQQQKTVIENSSTNQKPTTISLKEKANQYMNLAGIKNAVIISEGHTVIVEYDPREVEYEYELLNQWGKIFGVISKTYPNAEKISIIQKYGGESIFQITANSSDVRAIVDNTIPIIDFKKRLEFRAIKK